MQAETQETTGVAVTPTAMAAKTGETEEAPPASSAPPPGDKPTGSAVIAAVVKTLPQAPGVYRMLNAKDEVLYVGKARSLKKRVVNYVNTSNLSNRIQRMVSETASMEIIVTASEIEALLLESNLIKKLLPKYNVLLRDNKAFPEILLPNDHPFPQVIKHRGAHRRPGAYFGPFAASHVVGKAIASLQRAFLLRNCSDTVFSSRSRPCLQYEIKRCSAPCVGRISQEDYAQLVEQAKGFLSGRSREIQSYFLERMQAASDALDFESAARFRDRVRALTAIQAHQGVHVSGVVDDADIFALHQAGGASCVEAFFFRNGSNYGARAYFPNHDREAESDEIMGAFLGQFYADKVPAPLILLSEPPAEAALIAEALSVRAERKVTLATPQRGPKKALLDQAMTNAREALGRRLAERSAQTTLLARTAEIFGLKAPPKRIEVYDNSHNRGAQALGAMIVAGPEGLMKAAYRRFNIKGPVTPGDDYAMMREVLTRRFERVLRENPERDGPDWPDLVLIDGGAGQLAAVLGVAKELGVDDIAFVGVAKGPDRDAGRERFFTPDKAPFQLEPKDPALYFLQRLRDEAHRFAIGAHRKKSARALQGSELDEIPGVGPSRRRALLRHFGSARAVAQAGLADLESAPGVNKSVAKKIYDHFYGDG